MQLNPETAFYASPAGTIRITTDGVGITSLVFADGDAPATAEPLSALLADCIGQLKSYFAGELRNFTVPLAPAGTEFQLKVWAELVKIPYGQVITYRDLARRLGGPNYTRIVGQANGKNPVSILIPCHRVIGMNGALTGYAGGLWRKRFLLDLEQKGGSAGFSPTLFGND